MKKVSYFMLLLLCSCSNSKEVGYAHLLKEKKVKLRQVEDLNLDFTLFRESETDGILYFNLHTDDFLSMRDSVGKWSVQAAVELTVYNNAFRTNTFVEEKKQLQTEKGGSWRDSIFFQLPEGKDVYINLKVIDENKHVYRLYAFHWERGEDFIPEDLLLWNIDSSFAITTSFWSKEQVRLISRSNGKEYVLELYENCFSPAARMYDIQDKKPPLFIEEKQEVKGNIQEISQKLNTLTSDFYCRIYPVFSEKKIETTQMFCCTKSLHRSVVGFAPLRYLLNETHDKNEPISVNLWLQFWENASGGNAAKAEQLIQEFYRRVDYANMNYSSYKTGWQTDRGMLYILCGIPDRVEQDVRGEIWYYNIGTQGVQQFFFARNPNDLHVKDYVLERNYTFRPIWQSAVQKWENGWVKIGELGG